MSKFNIPKFPSVSELKAQSPFQSSDFMSKAQETISKKTSEFLSVDDMKSKFADKIQDKLGGIDIYNIPEPPSAGEKIAEYGAKVGIDVDSAKIDAIYDKVRYFKSSPGAAIEGAKSLAEKVGVEIDLSKHDDKLQKAKTVVGAIGEKSFSGAQKAANALGIDIDLSGIEQTKDNLLEKGKEQIANLEEKTSGARDLVPSTEQIAQMIVDSNPEDVEAIDNKVASIMSFIESKLS